MVTSSNNLRDMRRVVSARERISSADPEALTICAQCTHAEPFAVHPFVQCRSAKSRLANRTLYMGHPACPHATARAGDDLILAKYLWHPQPIVEREGRVP